MYILQETSISSSIKWDTGKDGTNHKDGPDGMFATERERIFLFFLFLPRLLLSYRTIQHVGKLETRLATMGRQLNAPLTIAIFYE